MKPQTMNGFEPKTFNGMLTKQVTMVLEPISLALEPKTLSTHSAEMG